MLDAKDICAAVFVCGMIFGHSFTLKKCADEAACIVQLGDAVVQNGMTLIVRPIRNKSSDIAFEDNIPRSGKNEDEIVKHRIAAYDITKYF